VFIGWSFLLGDAGKRGIGRSGSAASALRESGQHRSRDQLEDATAVRGDPVGDFAATGEGLVEEHRPGGAVAVEKREEGADAGAQRVAGADGGGNGIGDSRRQGVPGGLHAGGVEALLVAEVVVEERLGDADRRRDLIHRHRCITALGEERAGGSQRLGHAVVAGESGSGNRCIHRCRGYPNINLYASNTRTTPMLRDIMFFNI
jgi:hypothetical protein